MKVLKVSIFIFAMLASPCLLQLVTVNKNVDANSLNALVFNCVQNVIGTVYDIGMKIEEKGFDSLDDDFKIIHAAQHELLKCKELKYIKLNKEECVDMITESVTSILAQLQDFQVTLLNAWKGINILKEVYSRFFKIIDICVDSEQFDKDHQITNGDSSLKGRKSLESIRQNEEELTRFVEDLKKHKGPGTKEKIVNFLKPGKHFKSKSKGEVRRKKPQFKSTKRTQSDPIHEKK